MDRQVEEKRNQTNYAKILTMAASALVMIYGVALNNAYLMVFAALIFVLMTWHSVLRGSNRS